MTATDRYRAIAPCDYCANRSASALATAAAGCDDCLRALLMFVAAERRRYFEAHHAGLQGKPWEADNELEREAYTLGVKIPGFYTLRTHAPGPAHRMIGRRVLTCCGLRPAIFPARPGRSWASLRPDGGDGCNNSPKNAGSSCS